MESYIYRKSFVYRGYAVPFAGKPNLFACPESPQKKRRTGRGSPCPHPKPKTSPIEEKPFPPDSLFFFRKFLKSSVPRLVGRSRGGFLKVFPNFRKFLLLVRRVSRKSCPNEGNGGNGVSGDCVRCGRRYTGMESLYGV